MELCNDVTLQELVDLNPQDSPLLIKLSNVKVQATQRFKELEDAHTVRINILNDSSATLDSSKLQEPTLPTKITTQQLPTPHSSADSTPAIVTARPLIYSPSRSIVVDEYPDYDEMEDEDVPAAVLSQLNDESSLAIAAFNAAFDEFEFCEEEYDLANQHFEIDEQVARYEIGEKRKEGEVFDMVIPKRARA